MCVELPWQPLKPQRCSKTAWTTACNACASSPLTWYSFPGLPTVSRRSSRLDEIKLLYYCLYKLYYLLYTNYAIYYIICYLLYYIILFIIAYKYDINYSIEIIRKSCKRVCSKLNYKQQKGHWTLITACMVERQHKGEHFVAEFAKVFSGYKPRGELLFANYKYRAYESS